MPTTSSKQPDLAFALAAVKLVVVSKPNRDQVATTNTDLAEYERVDKRQTYTLAQRSGDVFDEDYRLEPCSLLSPPEIFARALGQSLTSIGFAVVCDTGIDPQLYEVAHQWVCDMFERPSADKHRFLAKRHGAVNQGYFPFAATTEVHPDMVEGWVLCRRAFNLDNDPAFEPSAWWPAAELEHSFRRFVASHLPLCRPLCQAMLRAIGAPPEHLDPWLSRPAFGLRLNYYPPLSPTHLNSGAGRLLGHEDVNLFTLLPAPTIEGLQVLNRKNGKWIRLSAPPGSLIVNTGDYMQRISGDRLPSTTHRVALPRSAELCAQVRTSFPINIYLPEDVMLEQLPGLGPVRYPPIRALSFHTQITSKFYGDDYAVRD